MENGLLIIKMEELIEYFKSKDKTQAYNWNSLIIIDKVKEVYLNDKSKYDKFVMFKKLFETKRVSHQYYIDRGWSEHVALDKLSKTTEKRKLTKEKFIERYGEKEGKRKWEEFLDKSKQSESSFISRYGEKEGKIKWEEYKLINSHSKTLLGYIEKFGEEEGKRKWEEKNKKQSFSNTKAGYIKRYGEEYGLKKWKQQSKNKSRNKQFFIKKYGIEIGEEKYKKFLNKCEKTLDNFVRLYGEEMGKERYNEFNEKNAHSNRYEYYLEKYGIGLGDKKFKEKILKMNTRNYKVGEASIESLKIFNQLNNKLTEYGYELNIDYFYGVQESNEFSFVGDRRLYDFSILPLKLIFEYNGSHVHPSKKLTESEWNEWTNPFTGQSADEKYSQDRNKILFAEKQGFSVVEIWDYMSDDEILYLVDSEVEKRIS